MWFHKVTGTHARDVITGLRLNVAQGFIIWSAMIA